MERRLPLLILLLGTSVGGATCKGGREAPTVESPPASEAEAPIVRAPAVVELEGVNIYDIPSAYRADALRVLNESFCYCGCARTVASCLGNRANCPCVNCSERVANFVISEYKRGATTADVESALVEAFSESYSARPYEFDLSNQAVLGPADAKHTFVEFADFRCPHCKTAFAELVRFVQSRPDARLVYYYFPLNGFGEVSVRAATAAEAARRQGKFWEMAALLYQNQLALEEADIMGYAQAAGLDLARFKKDFGDDETRSAVMADKAIGMEVGVQGTPAIFIGGRPLGLPHDKDSLALRLAMEDDRESCD